MAAFDETHPLVYGACSGVYTRGGEKYILDRTHKHRWGDQYLRGGGDVKGRVLDVCVDVGAVYFKSFGGNYYAGNGDSD